MHSFALRCCWLSLPCLSLISGCGGGIGDLSGNVTYQGKPLRMGSINVVGGDGIIRAGTIKDDGTYAVTGLSAGTVKIAITSPDPTKRTLASKPKSGAKVPPMQDSSKWFAIPDNYGDFEKSGLTFPLQRGENSFAIDLK